MLALLLLLCAHPAQAQTACSVLSQSQLLNSFSDTAPAGSISPRNMRDFVCSSALLSSSGTGISGDGAMFLNSGSGVTLQDASQANVLFPLGINLSRAIAKTTPFFPPTINQTGLYQVLNPLSGTCGSGPGACYLNYFQSNEGGSNGVATPSGSLGLMGWLMLDTGGSGMVGGRVTGDFQYKLTTAPSGNTSPAQTNYAAFRASSFASTNDNGTSAASPFTGGHSALFGGNLVATLLNGATSWNGDVGLEVDISVDTGASVIDKIGEQVVVLADDAVAATRWNLGYSVNGGSASSPGLDIGYSIGSGAGFDPIAATGSLFACALRNKLTACGTHAYGIDLLDFGNFTTAAFASNGFLVDGSGNVTGAGLTVAVTGFTPFDSNSWSNSFVRNGRVFSSSGNQFGLYSETTVAAASGGAADYEKGALFGSCILNDISGAHLYDCVGADLRSYISATNTLGRAWGSVQEAIINAGGNGILVGTELDIVNNGTDQAAVNTTTSKYGLQIIAEGSNDTTAGIFGQTSPRKFHNFIYVDPGTITSGGYFINFPTAFTVDGSGNVTGASFKAGANAGANCGAGTLNTSTAVVTGGIVTHC